jgi:carbon-monoxide dehydrogenase large subunit
MNATTFPYTGQPLKRREDFKFLTGKGRYVDDIKLPGMLYVAIARSPHAHAIIRNVDLSSAKTAPGVRLALAGKDLGDKIGPIVPNWILPGPRCPSGRWSRPTACALLESAWRSLSPRRSRRPTTPWA